MLYDLINMSDDYTFRADTLECAAVVTLLLGNGQYGASPHEEEKISRGEAPSGIPIFMVGGAEAWFQDKFKRSMEAVVHQFLLGDGRAELVTALRSVLVGDRSAYEATRPMIIEEKRADWERWWKNRHRSSLNDVGRRSEQWADKIERGQARQVTPVPLQVLIV